MEHIAVKSHFAHIDRKITDTHIRHTLPDFTCSSGDSQT